MFVPKTKLQLSRVLAVLVRAPLLDPALPAFHRKAFTIAIPSTKPQAE